jgi:hypothetical protein
MTRMCDRLLIPTIVVYCMVFLMQEKLCKEFVANLQPIPSAQFLQATTGYLHQLFAEIFFIQSSVFLGGIKPGTDPQSYAPALAHNYRQITSLYPAFNDPYYYSQSYLAYVSREFARSANDILAIGCKAYPENLIYPFFQGFNLFSYLDEPLEASKVFREASLLPKAPPMFAHLAALLSAKGGNIAAGLISLQTMLAAEKDEIVRARYQQEIVIFEQALNVQTALNNYASKYGDAPKTLEQLVPEFLSQLPETNDFFDLIYDPPTLRLQRPDQKKKRVPGIPWK